MVFGDLLVVSPEGIEFHAIGRHGFVQWHDMRRFVRKFGSKEGRSAWGIEFNISALHSKGLLARLFIFDDTYLDNIIPLDAFLFPNRGLSIWGDFDLKRFKQTPLGSDIYHYAPHLFGSDEKPKRSEYRIYRPPIAIRSMFAVFLVSISVGSLLLASILLTMAFQFSLILLIPVCLLVFGVCRVIWDMFHTVFVERLIVSSKGIRFHMMGRQGFAYWEDMKQFARRGWARDSTFGILFEPQVLTSKSLLARLFLRDTAFDTIVPLRHFVFGKHTLLWGWPDLERFKQTPLGSDIYYYAPHLF